MAALHFLLPTGDSRSGRRSLIPTSSPFSRSTRFRSRPPLRRPRPLRFERLRVGGEGKADANLTNFLSTCCALAPQLAATPWGGSPPRPLCQKICYQTAQKTALCAPASTQEVSESENPPATRGTAHSEV